MQLRQLFYFVSVVDAGSFSRAATGIRVAQPALSQQVAELERELGVPLVVRSTRGIKPTRAGDTLYREAQQILYYTKRLPMLVAAEDCDVQGVVKLGISSIFGALTPFLAAAKARLPRVTLKTSITNSNTIKSLVASGEIDLGVIFEGETTIGFAQEWLCRHKLCFLRRGRRNAEHEPITLAAAAAGPLVLPAAPVVTRTVLDRAFARSHITPNIVAEVDQLPTILTAVQQAVGGTILPMLGGPFDKLPRKVASHRALDPPLYLTSSIVWASERSLAPETAAIKDALAGYLRDVLRGDPDGRHPIPIAPAIGA